MKANSILVMLVIFSAAISLDVAYCAGDLSAMQKAQMEQVVHDYLLQHPEVIMQSVQTFQQKQMVENMKKMQADVTKNATKHIDALFHQSSDPVFGNPNAKVTLVEFFDYQCGFCIRMYPVLENLIKANNDVRIVLKDFPIEGPMSELAAKVVIASQKQGKYIEFYKALMSSKQRPLTEDILYSLAQSIGLDVNQLKTDIKTDTINERIKVNLELARNLQVNGTPAIFIAKTNIPKDAPSSAIVFLYDGSLPELEAAIKKLSQ